uniref:Uncharacterized protein n=1 Tax=Bracon brevicornis TaxID=1563983 RepID=A0A6V7HZX6_9HYME
MRGHKKSIDGSKANVNEMKFIEIEALKAYNEKTLWKDRKKFNEVINEKWNDSNSSEMQRAIENIDWSLKSFPFPLSHSLECNSRSSLEWHNEISALILPIPHDNIHNTFEMLLFAFGYSDSRPVNGLDLGPPSEIYSNSEQIPNVFFEIIKTAVLRTVKHDCNCRRTADVDYGDSYWVEINI